MRITLKGLDLGYMGMDYERLVFPHPSFILTTARREGSKVWCNCPVISFIIEHPDGLILWETGISPDVESEWLPEWRFLTDVSDITPDVCLEARLKSIGVGPEDFRYVILGHLHCDHAGGLRLFERAGATVICHEDEYTHVSTIRQPDDFFVPRDWELFETNPPTTVSGDMEVLKNVWLISLPGHTPGSMGLLVKLDRTGWVFLTSDALYTHDSYGPPAVGTPITWHAEKWRQSVEKIRRLSHEQDAFVMPGHDATGIDHSAGVTGFRRIELLPDHVYE